MLGIKPHVLDTGAKGAAKRMVQSPVARKTETEVMPEMKTLVVHSAAALAIAPIVRSATMAAALAVAITLRSAAVLIAALVVHPAAVLIAALVVHPAAILTVALALVVETEPSFVWARDDEAMSVSIEKARLRVLVVATGRRLTIVLSSRVPSLFIVLRLAVVLLLVDVEGHTGPHICWRRGHMRQRRGVEVGFKRVYEARGVCAKHGDGCKMHNQTKSCLALRDAMSHGWFSALCILHAI
ncbi:hypothetical protein BDQ12DRAFT_669664 [Crucibulum laeve]|uniref:Uncharacterized protein n=1 Tax=Crucibulum laeve TaxID=68775 RepID=A0A5C3LN12_9AGAR|nr:hypothetical protein BDQ12DRAFT_669664 [Crucibulum laeve]